MSTRNNISPLAVYGIPRSGFALTLSILAELEFVKKTHRAAVEVINRNLGEIIFNEFLRNVKNSEARVCDWSPGFGYIVGGPREMRAGSLWVRKYIGLGKFGDVTFSIILPPLLGRLLPIYNSHIIDEGLSERESVLITQRHPCGIFESSVNSFNAITSEYIQRNPGCIVDEEIARRSLALYKITSPIIRTSLLNYLESAIKSYANAIGSGKSIQLLSWESFIKAPRINFDTIASSVGKYMNLSSRDIQIAFDRVSYKNTMLYHKHNYRPGHARIGGWLLELPVEIIQTILNFDQTDNYIEPFKRLLPDYFFVNSQSYPTSSFKKLATSLLNGNVVYPPGIDPILVEYSLQKSNVDHSVFVKDYYVDLTIGSVHIHRMSRKCDFMFPLFKKMSSIISHLSEALELFDRREKAVFFENYPDLTANINFFRKFLSFYYIK